MMNLCRTLFLLLLVSCNRQETAPAAVKPVESWEARGEKYASLIKTGMTQSEVLSVAGEPTQHKTIVGTETMQIWDYEVASNVYYRVFFDAKDRVTGSRLWSQNKVGG